MELYLLRHGAAEDRSLAGDDRARRLTAEGAEALRMSPRDFGALVASETTKWTKVVKQAGIKAE